MEAGINGREQEHFFGGIVEIPQLCTYHSGDQTNRESTILFSKKCICNVILDVTLIALQYNIYIYKYKEERERKRRKVIKWLNHGSSQLFYISTHFMLVFLFFDNQNCHL